jgi:hypothetical protein
MSLLDAGFSSTVVIQHRKPVDLGRNNSAQHREVMAALVDLLASSQGDVDSVTGNLNQATLGAKAGATLILSGGAGAVGGVINGVTVTATFATSDANTAGLVAAAINASSNALVQGFVRASNAFATLTLATMTAGSLVRIRLGSGMQASEYVLTAVAAATGRQGEFSISGTDTQDAQALCDAINAWPVLNQTIRAENVAGVAYLYAMDLSTSAKDVSVAGSGITRTAGFALGARCHVENPIPGAVGNAVTFTATGTGMTVANTNTRMVGGLGGVTGTIKRANALGV